MVVEMTFRILKGWWKNWICHYEIYQMWLQLAFFFVTYALSMEWVQEAKQTMQMEANHFLKHINRNQSKCNHSICDYMQLVVVCD
jgi:hypothetical protein